MSILLFLLFTPGIFTQDVPDITERSSDVSAALDAALRGAISQGFCTLIGGGCVPNYFDLNTANLNKPFNWGPVSVTTTASDVESGGIDGRTNDTLGDQPDPEPQCSDDMMVGNYHNAAFEESPAFLMDDCCALTDSDFPKWSWRPAEVDSEPGTCRVWAREAEQKEVNLVDDFDAWLENNLWFHGDSENILITLLQEGEDEEVTLVCEPSAQYHFLNKDYWDPLDGLFYESYRDLVKLIFVEAGVGTYEDVLAFKDELTEALNGRTEFIESLNDACSNDPDPQQCLEDLGYDRFMEIFSDWIATIRAKMDAILNNPLARPLLLLEQYETEGEKVCTVTNGILQNTETPKWLLSKSGDEVKEELASLAASSLNYTWSVDFDRNVDITRTADAVQPWASHYQEDHYEYSETIQDTYNFEFEVNIERWTEVAVQPGSWFDANFFDALEILEHTQGLAEPFSLCPREGKIHILGEGGRLQSMITRLYVATDMALNMHADATFIQEIQSSLTSECSKFGPICQGIACGTGGNVLLGGDDLINHGRFENNHNIDGWLYLQKAVQNIMGSAWRETSSPGVIVALGSAQRNFNYWDMAHDAGEAIMAVAHVLGYKVIYYNGGDRIRAFFNELRAGTTDPKMIWAAGDAEKGNDMEPDERDAMFQNAATLEEYIKSGGGFMSHGSGDNAYKWLQVVFPGLNEIAGCKSTGAYLTEIGKARFLGLDDSDLQAGSCHSHFEGDFHGLEVIARDGDGKAMIIGGYSAAIEAIDCVGSLIEEELVNVDITQVSQQDVQSSFRSGDGYGRIVGVYAPRYFDAYCV